MSPPAALPPLGALGRILRDVTERLARELESPSCVAPPWNELEWAIARAVATMQGISALLLHGTRWDAPAPWQAFLREQEGHLRLREQRTIELLQALDAALRAADCSAVMLKGASLLRRGLYLPGERPMSDIDVLVDAAAADRVAGTICACGFVEKHSMRRHRVFYFAGETVPHAMGDHVANPFKVELHRRIAEPLPASVVDITDTLRPAPEPGLVDYPSAGALALHLVIHAAGNMRARALRLIQLCDLARLAPQMSAADWQVVLADTRGAPRWWIAPPLLLTARYFPAAIPVAVLDAARAACPRRLRRASERAILYDVSWSRIDIQALAGSEWARTPLEWLRLVRARVLPERGALDDLATACAALPWMAHDRWYEVSHLRRIVRWTFSRPPRVQTLSCVRAALAASGPGTGARAQCSSV
jgi:hypothetical protein